MKTMLSQDIDPTLCDGCGSTADERSIHNPEGFGLTICPSCKATKCIMCDMGDDVECASCDPDDH